MNEIETKGRQVVYGVCWRDARRELPENNKDVLVYCDGCGSDDYYSLGRYAEGRWIDKFDTCVLDVIAWMPLPPIFCKEV